MENKYFHNNRKYVQQAFFVEQFLIPLIDKNELIIIEEKGERATLREVIIENFPITDEFRPKSYILDLESNKPTLGTINGTKTTEKALLLFTYDSLIVFMLEMKSTISNRVNNLSSIAQKLEDSIGRISMVLTAFIFDESFYENLAIQYVGLICFQQDAIRHKEHSLYDNLKEGKEDIFLDNALTGQREKVIIKFIKSADSTPSMTIDFDEIFPDETYNFQAEFSALTLPDIRK
jgi:hypothetical protein